MSRRLVITLDITGKQSEDMSQTADIIRALHNKGLYFNSMVVSSATDEELEVVYENEVEL